MLNFLRPYWLVILKYALIVGGFMAVVMRLISEGERREKVKQTERELNHVREHQKVDRQIRKTLRHTDIDSKRDWLRERAHRDSE